MASKYEMISELYRRTGAGVSVLRLPQLQVPFR